MKEFLIEGNSLPEAYHNAILTLYTNGEETPCKSQTENTKQREITATLVIDNSLAEPMISKFWIGGPYDLERYQQELLDGILDFEVDKGNWKYTYHRRMVMAGSLWQDQIQFVIDELKKDPYSRRAIIDIRDADEDMYSDEPACLQNIHYFIRDNKLHCKVLFRSNDACKATFMNAFALIMLQKRIADNLDVEVGSYTHRANSFHCYERDYELLYNYVKKIQMSNKIEDTTYNYIDNFKFLMDEEKDKVTKLVNSLK